MFKQRFLMMILIFVFGIVNVFGYGPDFVPGEIIITLSDNTRGAEVTTFLSAYSSYNLQEMETLSERSNTRLFSFSNSSISTTDLLLLLSEDENVATAMLNYYLEKEEIEVFDMTDIVLPENYNAPQGPNVPNDYFFSWQWALNNQGQTVRDITGVPGADIKALETWDLLATIPNINSRQIMAGAMDIYLETTHVDLQENMYLPPGYIYPPLNPLVTYNSHATMTSGLVSATSDNNMGISSIGGKVVDVKTVILDVRRPSIDGFINNMEYFLRQREMYNANMEEGLNIVAVYHSWSDLDRFFFNPSSYIFPYSYEAGNPFINQIKSLGEAGILFIWSAGNSKEHIQIPPGMDPEIYPKNLITVTATTSRDVRFDLVGGTAGGGYGKYTVDLGAPGRHITTTGHKDNLNDYVTTWGTSLSAPYVAGVIGLMYHAASDDLIQMSRTHPKETALLFKQYLLEGVDGTLDMQETTKTGGRLNALDPVMRLLEMQERIIEDTVFDGELIYIDKNIVIDKGAVVHISDSMILTATNSPHNGLFGYTVKDGTLIFENTYILTNLNVLKAVGPNSKIIFRNSTNTLVEAKEIEIRNAAQLIIENSQLSFDMPIKVINVDSEILIQDGSEIVFAGNLVEILHGAKMISNNSLLDISGNGQLRLEGSSFVEFNGSILNLLENSQILGHTHQKSIGEFIRIPGDRMFFLDGSIFNLGGNSAILAPGDTRWEGIYFADSAAHFNHGSVSGISAFSLNRGSKAYIDEVTFTNIEQLYVRTNSLLALSNSFYHNNSGCIYIDASFALLDNVSIYENESVGLFISNWPNNDIEIKHSKIYKNRDNGIQISRANVAILDCQIYENGKIGYQNITSGINTIGGTQIHDNVMFEIFARVESFPRFEKFNDENPKVFISANNPNPQSQYLFGVPIPPAGRACVHPVDLDQSDPGKFFPDISRYCFSLCSYTSVNWAIIYSSITQQEYITASDLLKDIIINFPETDDAQLAVSYLPFIQGKIDEDFDSLLSFLQKIDHDNLSEVTKRTTASANLFSQNYLAAISIYEDIIDTASDVMERLLAEIDQAYCYLMLVESGARSLPSQARRTPKSFEEFQAIQQEIYDFIFQLDTKEDNESVTKIHDIGMHNYPNPFNPSTMISFDIITEGHVRIDIYNIRGQRIQTVVNEHLGIGKHHVNWDGTDDNGSSVSSGIYFYRMNMEGFSQTRRMLLLK